MIKQDELSVQATNDDSIVSKRSAARFSYFNDEFLRCFVKKPPRRSPLINRGYYIRSKLIRDALIKFLSIEDMPKKQIVSLGAGFDTSFWVLKEGGWFESSKGQRYFEMDFPGVVKRKRDEIYQNKVLLDLIGKTYQQILEEAQHNLKRLEDGLGSGTITNLNYLAEKKSVFQGLEGYFPAHSLQKLESSSPMNVHQLLSSYDKDEIYTSDYSLLKGDLCDLPMIALKLANAGLDFNAPVLFLAECVMTYMPPDDSDRLISWVSKQFPNSVFVTYEQIIPYDTFGSVMCHTLKSRNSSLLGISTYPSLKSHRERYLKLGFSHSKICTLLEAYESALPKQEVERVEALEEFDELEEWVIKCQHYFLLVAVNGENNLNKFSSMFLLFPPEDKLALDDEYTGQATTKLDYKQERVLYSPEINNSSSFNINKAATQRIGHSVVSCTKGDNHYLYVFGGYGGNKGQQRLDDVAVFDELKNMWVEINANGSLPSARVFHTAVATQDKMIVFGGRLSPQKPLNDFYSLKFSSHEWEKWEMSGDVICHRWRHSAVLVQNLMIIFGGRGLTDLKNQFTALNDTYVVDLNTRHVQLVKTSNPPAPRFSHSAHVFEGKMIVFGGRDNQRYFNDLHMLDLQSNTWQLIETLGDIPKPRFSHSSNIVSLCSESTPSPVPHLLVIGGCSPLSRNEVYLLNLHTLKWHYSGDLCPVEQKESTKIPQMLVRHVSTQVNDKIYLIGGGALCFSFGTHFNGMSVFKVNHDHSIENEIQNTIQKQLPMEMVPQPVPILGPIPQKLTSIPILENPSKEYLFDTLIPSRQPAILRGLNIGNCVEDWKNIEYLKKKCGDKIVSIREFTTENLDFLNKNYEFKNVTFSEMLDLILQSPEVQKMRYYFRSIGENPRKEVSNVDKFSPELSADFKIPIQFESIKEKLFSSILRISSQRIRVWTHYDVMDNILCQVTGDKEITLWPPSDVPYLYVVGSTSSVLDIENPDLLKFPKFQYASPMKGVLKPGDVLFLPSLWFHNTITQTPSISINIFWKHLPDDQYWLKDLYGNRDPIIAEKCLEDLANCIQNIQKMPPHYSNFYLRKMKEMIDAKLNE